MLEMKEVAHMIEGRLVHVYLPVECGKVTVFFFYLRVRGWCFLQYYCSKPIQNYKEGIYTIQGVPLILQILKLQYLDFLKSVKRNR